MEEGEMKGREEMKLRREESVLFVYGSAMQHHWRDETVQTIWRLCLHYSTVESAQPSVGSLRVQ